MVCFNMWTSIKKRGRERELIQKENGRGKKLQREENDKRKREIE